MQASLRWNHDGESEWIDCHSDSSLAVPDKFLPLTSAVIPAKAGIQWFRQAIPATRE